MRDFYSCREIRRTTVGPREFWATKCSAALRLAGLRAWCMTSCAPTASAGPGSYRAYHGVVSPAASGTEALSHRPPPKRRAEGTPSPATWWSARAGLFPGPLPGPPPGPGVSHPVIGPCGKQMVRWLVLDPRVVVCTVAVSLCRPPCYPVQDRSLDGAGPLPAWHQPSANEFIPPAGAVLCHLLPLCVISRASLRKLSPLVRHTAGGEEAAARVQNGKRILAFSTPEIAVISHGDRREKTDFFAGRPTRSLGSPKLRIKKIIYRIGTFVV